jgi:hypothetical protein
MAEPPPTQARPIPQELSDLVVLNVEYSVLICRSEKCQYALKPTAISRHLGDKHNTPIALRKQVDQYVKVFPFTYDYATIPLPQDGSAPQPIIPIVDGFVCRDCPVKSQNRRVMRQHANKDHDKKWVADKDMFKVVQLQSWFGEKRERYWVVDENRQDEQARHIVCDVGETSSDTETSSNTELQSNYEQAGQEPVNDQIIQEIEQWKQAAQERRLQALKDIPSIEMDSWLQYTKWNEVLSQSKHNMIKTYEYTHEPDPDEPALNRVIRAWSRILERCLDTLAATD